MKHFFAFSGTHGVGKSTAAVQLCHYLMIARPRESVRLLVDLESECPFPINQGTTEAAQKWLFNNQMQQELCAIDRYDSVITDRTIIDIVAYTFVAGFQALAEGMLGMAAQHLDHYDDINFKRIRFNEFCYDNGIRAAHDPAYRQEVELVITDIYNQFAAENMLVGKLRYV